MKKGQGTAEYILILPLVFIVFFAVAFCIGRALASTPGLAQGVAQLSASQFIPSDHAVEKHGDEALLVRDCMKDNGPYQTWKAQRGDRFFKICEINPGEFGLQVVEFEEDTEYEVTAFVPDDPSLRGVIDYLKKFATPFKGTLP